MRPDWTYDRIYVRLERDSFGRTHGRKASLVTNPDQAVGSRGSKPFGKERRYVAIDVPPSHGRTFGDLTHARTQASDARFSGVAPNVEFQVCAESLRLGSRILASPRSHPRRHRNYDCTHARTEPRSLDARRDFLGVMAPKPVPSRNTFSRAVQPEPPRDARRRLDLESGKGTLCPRLRAKPRFPKVSISKVVGAGWKPCHRGRPFSFFSI